LFNDAYNAIALAVCTLGKQNKPAYYTKPSAKARRLQEQLEKYPSVKVVEIEAALNEAAQQDLVSSKTRLVSVNPPSWLHLKKMAPKALAPKPKFVKLD
jgi:poly-gamma-glutamate capsule biosynthesis protein CapA/YwtB (metallophosphatase superfamily)